LALSKGSCRVTLYACKTCPKKRSSTMQLPSTWGAHAPTLAHHDASAFQMIIHLSGTAWPWQGPCESSPTALLTCLALPLGVTVPPGPFALGSRGSSPSSTTHSGRPQMQQEKLAKLSPAASI
jgi:hypothetical protein